MQEIDKGFMGINLKITTVLIFCVTACVSIPKIADATGDFGSLVAKGLSGADNSSLISPAQGSAGLADVYIPPNFGGPDSPHGSGTR